ncbi:riboflavin biosynthesis protein RibF [Oxobacter pfennigii]|uniref:Riboflavin biosynthesis protein n=1 Tax=Oxobacter pfennigii TaxID=36849 RepID=A0A0P8W745_9CLOT|nr:bifunctional riboflavin kinase/FAD synthetase [Oxobacter pfennigii]KPU43898.1 riboflavin biosynthesis protein RibF [Oxobacter pfennigii]
MEVIYGGVADTIREGPYACALGFFDGVHLGHQNLITALKDISVDKNYKTMVFTFEKHPLAFLNKENAPMLITDNCAKTEIFEGLGVDLLYFSKVDQDFLHTQPEEFLNEILIKKFDVKAIVAGFNFKFGFKGQGTSEYLLDYGKRKDLDIKIVEPIFYEGQLVSSTTIRSLIKQGDMEAVQKFMGRNFSICGNVIHGKARGRLMGIPTANIIAKPGLILPKSGVYATKVRVENSDVSYIAITNVGSNPTFGKNPITIETHIIDFSEDLYGRNIKIDFHYRIRDERAFNGPDDLASQVNKDKNYAVRYFNS